MSVELSSLRRGDSVSADGRVEGVDENGLFVRMRDDLPSVFVPFEAVTAWCRCKIEVKDRVRPYNGSTIGTVLLVGAGWAVVHLDHLPNPSVYDLDELERVPEPAEERTAR